MTNFIKFIANKRYQKIFHYYFLRISCFQKLFQIIVDAMRLGGF